ncbi:MAG TPA: FAD-dependent oxidoreductase [Beijerinckiaceae bacterium]|nr:FAD-dependent oxidoreductase [Beijerinckiaceae bacterium]
MRSDVLVLGAGFVGIGLALNLQAKGRSVTLVDRRGPGEETSYGNTGLIQSEAVMPYPFPTNPWVILQAALNLRTDAYYSPSSLPKVASFIYGYWREAAKDRVMRTARARAPIFEISIPEHEKLAQAAGAIAQFRPTGWLKVFRNDRNLADEIGKITELKQWNVEAAVLNHREVAAAEPGLTPGEIIGGVKYNGPISLAEPLALSRAYVELFKKQGGRVVTGDARSLQQEGDGWSVAVEGGRESARDCVIALGPWAKDVTEPLGYRMPLGVKRGYHMHFSARGNASLNGPILDGDVGYCLTPMTQGFRLTTGADFSDRDAPPVYVQVDRAEKAARGIFPLDSRLEDTPWMGRRPCTPDMIPVMGPAPRHKRLWFNFAHAHHGLTLAGSCGRFMAEMICGETTYCDPKPYSAERFG